MSKFQTSETLIQRAFSIANDSNYTAKTTFYNEFDSIFNADHKTYKYILLNALLAKTAMPEINPLALQKKSELAGAYDARSHCHKVIVPFERDYLNGALGNSNEPFLNKPARFMELSKENAVRGGKDKEILEKLCDLLPQITSEISFNALTDALNCCIKLGNAKQAIFEIQHKENIEKDIEKYLLKLLKNSYEGETLSLSIGSLMKAYVLNIAGKCSVYVHKVNQSGASSQEISDIDVYKDEEILYTIEAKDKEFNEYDVQHAISKSSASQAKTLFFIIGPRGDYTGKRSLDDLIDEAEKSNVNLVLIKSKAFIKQMTSLIIWNQQNNNFMKFVIECLQEAQMKDATVTYVMDTAKDFGIIN